MLSSRWPRSPSHGKCSKRFCGSSRSYDGSHYQRQRETFDVMHSRATDRRSASKCQGKWPDQTLDQTLGLPEVLVAVSTSRLSCKRAGKTRTLMPVWDSSGESRSIRPCSAREEASASSGGGARACASHEANTWGGKSMRAYQDLREFLSVLEQEQQLLRITDQVKFEPDLAAAACALARMGESSPAIVFNNITGCTNAQVAMNVHGSWPNHALALGMNKATPLRDQFFEFVRRFKQFPGELERVTTAPWQEVVVESNVNLFELMPLFRLNRGDGGFYIDKACIVSRDPDDWDNDDVENVGCYRLMVKGPNRIGIQTVPQHDISVQLAHAEARGHDLPIAIAVANEPIIFLMAATPLLYNQLEYKMAAVMQGKPYRVVKTAKGLDVPYGSEYVLEGRLLARQREVEGPFGEFPGYYSGGHR